MSSSEDESVPSLPSLRSPQPHKNDRSYGDGDSKQEQSGFESVNKGTGSSQNGSETLTARTMQSDNNSFSAHKSNADREASPLPARSNKYNGPPSTWRSWTASEQGLAASLDQVTAKDLAVHLYNAHCLKQRANKVGSQGRIQFPDREDEHDSRPGWQPPKRWTAWPLALDDVPREENISLWASQDSYRLNESRCRYNSQRQVLQEILIAQVLKKAKERNSHLEQEHDTLGSLETDIETESIRSNGRNAQGELKPTILLDDDISADLLQPAVRHVLAKLDGLLMGLHHARDAYIVAEYASSKLQNTLDNRGKRKRSISRASKGRPQPSNPLVNLEPAFGFTIGNGSILDAALPHGMTCSSIREKQLLQKRKADLRLRDWSDVLGIALITAWDPKVIHKAAIRCSALFGEAIKLRTLEENGGDPKEITVFPIAACSDTVNSGNEMLVGDWCSSSTPSRSPDSRRLGTTRKEWKIHCPFPACQRSTRGFFSSYALKRHLRQVHQSLTVSEQMKVEENEEQMVGGVHVDGFLLPVQAAEAWVAGGRRRRKNGRHKSNR